MFKPRFNSIVNNNPKNVETYVLIDVLNVEPKAIAVKIKLYPNNPWLMLSVLPPNKPTIK